MKTGSISFWMACALTFGVNAQTTTAPTGSLAEILSDDRALLINLGLNDLTTLQKHLMDQMKLTPQQREAFAAVEVSKLLSSPDKIEAGVKVVEDPAQLLEIGRLLTERGTRGAQNLLEYWPANPRTQAGTLPLAQGIDQVYLRAIEQAKLRSTRIENSITPENQEALGGAWERQQNLISLANYRRAHNLLTVGLCMDVANPRRAESLKTGAELLTPFLDEKFNVVNATRIAIGKMKLFSGDAKGAVEVFRQAAGDAKASKDQYFEASYFALVADAGSDAATLKRWVETNFQPASEEQKSMGAALALLDYRRACDKADRAVGEEKQPLNRAAVDILDRLADARPDLGAVIAQQMLARMPEKPDLSALPWRMLLSITQRAGDETAREKPTTSVIEQGAEAADRLLKMDIPDETRSRVLLTKAQLSVNLGKHDAAMNALLDFLEKYPRDSRVDSALNFASPLFGFNLAEESKLRFFKIVTAPPYSKNQHNLAFAQLLLKRNIADFSGDYSHKKEAMIANAKLAMDLCAKCPAEELQRARFNGLIARDQLLDLLPEKELAALSAEALEQADVILREKRTDAESRLIAAKTLLIRSALATHFDREKRVPFIEQNLEMLREMEKLTADLPEAEALMAEERLARVNQLIELNRVPEALEDLQKVLASGERGLNAALSALNALNAAYQSAVIDKNSDKIKSLALQRGAIANLLAKSAGKLPKISKQDLRQYQEFAAEASLAAAPHEPDAEKRKALLSDALAFYEACLKESDEPRLKLKLALANFQIPDYAKAHPLLSKLIADKSLGGPQLFDDAGKASWNDAYWEATYKVIKCQIELARQKTPGYELSEAKAYLNRLDVLWENPGGEKWSGKLDELKKEIEKN